VVDLVNEASLLPPGVRLAAPEVGFYRAQGPNPIQIKEPGGGSFVQLSFGFELNNFPLWIEPKTRTGITVFVGNGPRVTSLSIVVPPALVEGEWAPVIGFSQAALALRSGRGTLVEKSSPGADETTPNISLGLVTISRARLVYVFDPQGAVAAPAYAFSGTGRQKDSRQSARVTYLVAAITD